MIIKELKSPKWRLYWDHCWITCQQHLHSQPIPSPTTSSTRVSGPVKTLLRSIHSQYLTQSPHTAWHLALNNPCLLLSLAGKVAGTWGKSWQPPIPPKRNFFFALSIISRWNLRWSWLSIVLKYITPGSGRGGGPFWRDTSEDEGNVTLTFKASLFRNQAGLIFMLLSASQRRQQS